MQDESPNSGGAFEGEMHGLEHAEPVRVHMIRLECEMIRDRKAVVDEEVLGDGDR